MGARVLLYGVREGGDGDELYVDSEELIEFVDNQSRDMRDFFRNARRVR